MVRSVCLRFAAVGILVSALTSAPATVLAQSNPSCSDAPGGNGPCDDGKNGPFAALTASEVNTLVAIASTAVQSNTMTVAVVDRAGRVLALYRQPGATPANDDLAVGLARTSAFFSHNMAPLSSRTVRFISGIHFPAGVRHSGNAALYGIENTNRGCDFNVTFNPGKCIPRATSVNGLPCNAFDHSGCGTGIVTGKPDEFDGHKDGHPEGVGLGASALNPNGLPVNPGGVPIFRINTVKVLNMGDDGSFNVTVNRDDKGNPAEANSGLVGGVGVAGVPPDQAEFSAFFAVAGAAAAAGLKLFPAPIFPLPPPGRVFIDGIRLPYVDNGTRPEGIQNGAANAAGTFVMGPSAGGCAANRYLAGPIAGSKLTQQEVDTIVHNAVDTAHRTRGYIRLPLNSYARMVIAVADVDGSLLALYRMPDATIFSIDVAVAKSRNVIYFSSNDPNVKRDLPGVPVGTSMTNRSIEFGAEPLYPPGQEQTDPGPFFDLFVRDLKNPCSQGFQAANANQSGIVFFPGATALYKGGQIVGGLGVSGDGVEQDDFVTVGGAGALLPEKKIQADRVMIRRVRLPFIKFPRQPEGVTEVLTDADNF